MSWNTIHLSAVLDKYKNLIIAAFFLLYLLIGIFIYKDYGFSYDEGVNRGNGAITANYINQLLGSPVTLNDSLPDFKTYKDRDYGVLFELVLIAFEFAFKLKDSQHIYQTRHLLTFLMFYVGVIFFYFLVFRVFDNWKIGLLGCLFLVISPRIFAHSFYNSKDSILLSFCIISTFTLIRFLDNKTLKSALFHALACAAVINIRIVGIYIPVVTALFLGIELLKSEDRKNYLITIWPGVSLYVMLFLMFTYLFWPYLWENPVGNFIQAFKNMSRFRWDSEVFYWGRFVKAYELPWHYIPCWIGITTPLLFSMLFLAGVASVITTFFKKPLIIYKNEFERDGLLFLLLFFMPLCAVIVLGSVLYDGWRQMFFIYPSFICISLIGFKRLQKIIIESKFKRGGRALLSISLVLFILGMITPLHFMMKNHPYQHVFFNALAGKNRMNKFDLDYWGLSYREALEYILENDSAGEVLVTITSSTKDGFFKILEKKDRERIRNVSLDESSYLVSNYRSPQYYYPYKEKQYPFVHEIFSVTVNTDKIVGVYKLK